MFSLFAVPDPYKKKHNVPVSSYLPYTKRSSPGKNYALEWDKIREEQRGGSHDADDQEESVAGIKKCVLGRRRRKKNVMGGR